MAHELADQIILPRHVPWHSTRAPAGMQVLDTAAPQQLAKQSAHGARAKGQAMHPSPDVGSAGCWAKAYAPAPMVAPPGVAGEVLESRSSDSHLPTQQRVAFVQIASVRHARVEPGDINAMPPPQ